MNLHCLPAASVSINWLGASIDARNDLPNAVLSCTEGGNSFSVNHTSLNVLREDFQLPIDNANPSAVTAQNYAHTLMVPGPHWLHLQDYVADRVEINYDNAICH